MCDLCRKAFVVHKEKVDVPYVVNQEFLETIGEEMASLLVASITDLFVSSDEYCRNVWMMIAGVTYLGHRKLTFETTPDPVINTLGFPPCFLHPMVTVGLVTPTFREKVSISSCHQACLGAERLT